MLYLTPCSLLSLSLGISFPRQCLHVRPPFLPFTHLFILERFYRYSTVSFCWSRLSPERLFLRDLDPGRPVLPWSNSYVHFSRAGVWEWSRFGLWTRGDSPVFPFPSPSSSFSSDVSRDSQWVAYSLPTGPLRPFPTDYSRPVPFPSNWCEPPLFPSVSLFVSVSPRPPAPVVPPLRT